MVAEKGIEGQGEFVMYELFERRGRLAHWRLEVPGGTLCEYKGPEGFVRVAVICVASELSFESFRSTEVGK